MAQFTFCVENWHAYKYGEYLNFSIYLIETENDNRTVIVTVTSNAKHSQFKSILDLFLI